MQCDALILGGGLGSRMGYQNKALVKFQGQCLFAHVLKTLQSLNLDGKIYLSLNQDLDVVSELYPELEIFSDDADLKQQGPLGGLLSFYRHYQKQSQHVFICPCDTPFISRKLLLKLYQAFTEDGIEHNLMPDGMSLPSYRAALPNLKTTLPSSRILLHSSRISLVCAESSQGLEPSIMLARTSALGVIEKMRAEHEKLSLKNLFNRLDGRSVYFASIKDFYNINTLSELNNEGLI